MTIIAKQGDSIFMAVDSPASETACVIDVSSRTIHTGVPVQRLFKFGVWENSEDRPDVLEASIGFKTIPSQ